MNAQEPTDGLTLLGNAADYPLVLGGPLSQIARRAHPVWRRAGALVAITRSRRPG